MQNASLVTIIWKQKQNSGLFSDTWQKFVYTRIKLMQFNQKRTGFSILSCSSCIFYPPVIEYLRIYVIGAYYVLGGCIWRTKPR